MITFFFKYKLKNHFTLTGNRKIIIQLLFKYG